jgi:hypothetical protein
MRLRSKILGTALLPLLAIGLLAPSASASEKKVPGAPYSVHIPAGQACDFAVTISGHDATVLTPLPGGGIYSHGYFDVLVTNPANGKSVFRVADGPGNFGPQGLVLYARGAWFDLVAPMHGHKARLIFISGSKFRLNNTTGQPYDLAPDVIVQNLCRYVA